MSGEPHPFGVASLLPPVVAVVLAIISRNVPLSLAVGLLSGAWLLDHHILNAAQIATGTLWELLHQGWVVKTLLFALFVGAIIELIDLGGGIGGFVTFVERKKGWITSKKEAELLPFFVGLAIFIESSITSLVAGTVARPLTDRFGTSREKLAYICDSTASPVCTLFPLNAWGALLVGLIGAQTGAGLIEGEPLSLLLSAWWFNFYAFFSIGIVLYTILRGIDFPATTPVRPVSIRLKGEGDLNALLIPVTSLLMGAAAALFYTGGGNPLKGSGSSAVFTGVFLSVAVTGGYLLIRGKTATAVISAIVKGVRSMAPVVAILLLAFALGAITEKLHTGAYLAGYAQQILHPALLPAGIFLLSALIAFATGTSWGTFSIMMPIALGIAAAMGPQVTPLIPVLIAAVMSGGVFGDHASPISDTTIIAAMAAGCDLFAHVKTQLPWAALAAIFSLAGFLFAGIWLTA